MKNEKVILEYQKSVDQLVREFYRKYYFEPWENTEQNDTLFDMEYSYNVDLMKYHWTLWPINITDYYWCIDDIIIALKYNIPEKILFKYYDESIEASMNNKPIWINLYNYYLKEKWK